MNTQIVDGEIILDPMSMYKQGLGEGYGILLAWLDYTVRNAPNSKELARTLRVKLEQEGI
jgi:hypothetical protein